MNHEIERRANISYQDFVKEYESCNKPVIITDALRRWKAVGKWTPEFFKREFGNRNLAIDKVAWGKYNGDSGREVTMGSFVDRVLESTEEKPAPYLRNQNLLDLFPSLMQDIEPMSEYCFPNWLPEPYLAKNLQRAFREHSEVQFYFGGKGGSFPYLHFDVLATHAFLMEIYGRKQFILFSPDQEKYLYRNLKNYSHVENVENPDLQKFPLFAKAEPTVFVLEPGELLFVPSRWWHTTKMLTACISVSLNVVNNSNWDALTEWVASGRKPALRFPSRVYLNIAGLLRSRRDQKVNLV